MFESIRYWWRKMHEEKVHRVAPHPRLGELRFDGVRTKTGAVSGFWKISPPGFPAPITVQFNDWDGPDGFPLPIHLERVEQILADLDAFYARHKVELNEAYEQMVEKPLPADWRQALRLDGIDLEDPEVEDPEWQLQYWCEDALHWMVVWLRGDTITSVDMEG